MTKWCFYVKIGFITNRQLCEARPGLSGNPFYATQWSEKIDFVEPKGLGALRQAQDKLQADKAAPNNKIEL